MIYPSTLGGGGAAGLESADIFFSFAPQPVKKEMNAAEQNSIKKNLLVTNFTVGYFKNKIKLYSEA